MESWEDKFVRILEADDWIIDCDKENKRYRVSYFEDCHFVDECWFDAYEDKKMDDTYNTKLTGNNDDKYKTRELQVYEAIDNLAEIQYYTCLSEEEAEYLKSLNGKLIINEDFFKNEFK